jgi:hypothetical protein
MVAIREHANRDLHVGGAEAGLHADARHGALAVDMGLEGEDLQRIPVGAFTQGSKERYVLSRIDGQRSLTGSPP